MDLYRLWIIDNSTCMAFGAGDILVAGITNLSVAQVAENFGVFIEHIFRVGEVMAGAVVAESLSMTDEAIFLICVCDIAMLDGPAEILMRGGCLANDHRGFDDQIAFSPDDGYGMAQVALGTD